MRHAKLIEMFIFEFLAGFRKIATSTTKQYSVIVVITRTPLSSDGKYRGAFSLKDRSSNMETSLCMHFIS